MNQRNNPVTFGFLMLPGFPMACLTSAIEPLRAANEIVGQAIFAWRLVGETTEPVQCSADVRFTPDLTLDDCAEGLNYLLFLAPPTGRFADPRRSAARVRRLDRAGVVLGGFSGGIFPLARSGLLEGHQCSVHWCYDAAFKAEFPDIKATETVITRDRRRITASGSGAVFDLMLRLIEERLGRDTMSEVACWFQHPFVRDENASQKIPVPKAGGTADMLPWQIREAVRIFGEHLEDPLRVGDVATEVGMSQRHFERCFKQETGQSPLRYYRLMRLRRARQRVLYSNDSITEIALEVGYASATPMVRYYTEAFGVRPSDERRRLSGMRGLAGGQIPNE